MLKFSLLLILPCLIVADTQCAEGDISCPIGTTCCTVGGKPSCCNADSKPPVHQQHVGGNLSAVAVQDGIFDECTMFTCPGTCCNSGSMGCCSNFKMATCCSKDELEWCCPHRTRCGKYFLTCAGVVLSPATLVALLAVWMTVYVTTKM